MMRLFNAICFLLLLMSISPVMAKDYVVKKVIDGDTIQLESGETVRYLGIDAPEIIAKGGGSEFYAREAARYNKKLVFMKKVRLEFDVEKKDNYGRLLAYVFVKDLFVNAELVKYGYAKAYIKPPNEKYKDKTRRYFYGINRNNCFNIRLCGDHGFQERIDCGGREYPDYPCG